MAKVTYVDCDLAECPERVGPLDDNHEHADLAGWISVRLGVYKLNPEEIRDEVEGRKEIAGPFGMMVMEFGTRNQLEAQPLEGQFCSWPHAIAWLQSEALIWQAAEAGR